MLKLLLTVVLVFCQVGPGGEPSKQLQKTRAIALSEKDQQRTASLLTELHARSADARSAFHDVLSVVLEPDKAL